MSGLTFWYNQGFQLEAIVNHDKLTISYQLVFEDSIRNLIFSNKNYLHELDSLHQQTPRFTFS
jgi:hypothetical protein